MASSYALFKQKQKFSFFLSKKKKNRGRGIFSTFSLHPKFYLPRLSGSVLKVWGGLVGCCLGRWCKPTLVFIFRPLVELNNKNKIRVCSRHNVPTCSLFYVLGSCIYVCKSFNSINILLFCIRIYS